MRLRVSADSLWRVTRRVGSSCCAAESIRRVSKQLHRNRRAVSCYRVEIGAALGVTLSNTQSGTSVCESCLDRHRLYDFRLSARLVVNLDDSLSWHAAAERSSEIRGIGTGRGRFRWESEDRGGS